MNSRRIWVLVSLLIVFFCRMLETHIHRSMGNTEHTHRHRVPCAAAWWLSGLPGTAHHCAPNHYPWWRTLSTDTARHSCEIWDYCQIKGCSVPQPSGISDCFERAAEQCWTEFPETKICPGLEMLEQGWRNPSSQHNNALTARISDNTLFLPSSLIYLLQAAIVRN